MILTDIFDEHGIEYRTEGQHHHVRRGWIGVDCCYCSPHSGKFRLGINLSKGFANCWTCGGKRLIDVTSRLTGLASPVVARMLADLSLLPSQRNVPTGHTGHLRLPSGLEPLGKVHRGYLRKRGFDPNSIEKLWNIKGISLSGSRLDWRVWIPIIHRGQTVSWTTRSVGNNSMRYVTAKPEEESIRAKTLLYGGDYVRNAVVVCEGPLDAWRLGPGAVATMGLAVSLSQTYRLGRIPSRTICFDNEPEAQKRAERLAKTLEPLPGVTHVIRIESGKDVAEADSEEVEQIRNQYLM